MNAKIRSEPFETERYVFYLEKTPPGTWHVGYKPFLWHAAEGTEHCLAYSEKPYDGSDLFLLQARELATGVLAPVDPHPMGAVYTDEHRAAARHYGLSCGCR